MFLEITAIGNLGDNPEMRYTPQGDAVTNFSLATNRKWNNPDGSKGEQVTWLRVTVWGKQAEACNQYLVKGQQVFIKGSLTPDKQTGGPKIYTRPDGTTGTSYEVRALIVNFLSKPQNANSGQQQSQDQQRPQPQQQPRQPNPENDVPF